MLKKVSVTFPGGKKVYAHCNGMTIQTDQPIKDGGEGSAPEPFDLFFASIATCSGIYALEFCQTRGLNTAGLAVEVTAERKPEAKMFERIDIKLTLPEDFPVKYKKAVLTAIDLCTVKKHIVNPPEFNLSIG